MSSHGDHEHGAAWRRHQHRLRTHWRHGQLTLQMALAASLPHCRDVGPRVVQRSTEPEDCQGREVGSRALHGEDPEAPTSLEPGTQHLFLDNDSVPELG